MEFGSKRVKGATNVPISSMSAQDFTNFDRNKEMFVYCKSGGRARKGAEKLHELGFTNIVCVQEGGCDQLTNATIGGFDAEEPANAPKVWSLDRQVRFTAGSLVLIGTTVGLTVNPMLGMLISGGIGGGLVFSAVTDTCAMGEVLMKMPWNKTNTNLCPVVKPASADAVKKE